MKSFNEKVKEVIGIFDGVPEGGLPLDEDLDDHVDGQDFDPLIHAEVILLHKGSDMMAKVLGQKQDADGNLVGRKNCIPTMDT